jgi:hypothetical protein
MDEKRGTGSREHTGGNPKGYAEEKDGGSPNYQPKTSDANGVGGDATPKKS